MKRGDTGQLHAVKAMATAALALVTCVGLTGPAKAQAPSAGEKTPTGSSAQPTQAKPAPSPGSFENGAAEHGSQPTAIHIIPPSRGHRERLSGRIEIQTLIIDPSIETVEFLLDGSRTRRVTKKPYTTRVKLADPAREQALEVRGYDAQGQHLGRDSIVLNRVNTAFTVRIAEIRRVKVGDYAMVRVEAAVSVPRSASLARVEFYRGQHLVEALRDFDEEAAPDAPRTIAVECLMESAPADDFIRVVAKLADGREWEDAELLQGADYRGEIDVQLVQLQVLVTNRKGNPASDLEPDDFQVWENGEKRPVEGLHHAGDIPLVLGLALDSSSSVLPIRRHLIDLSARFLETALSSGDRAFLVHFNQTVRVLQPPTGHTQLLTSRLNYLDPKGGTALNDAILFSLLQYRAEPGRRALVVVTDGFDEHSRSEPNQSADFAERLGLPIYFIQLNRSNTRDLVNRARGRSHSATSRLREHRRAQQHLLRISEQTGGRLFTIELFTGSAPWTEQLKQVFDQIQDDLRRQYVLTYYSNQPPGAAIVPEVRVTRRGLTLRSAVPLE